MTKPPKWLHDELISMLPELECWKTPSPEATEAIQQWRTRIDTLFLSRGLGTPYQQRNPLTAVRSAIKSAYGENHPALDIVCFDEATWHDINNRQSQRPKSATVMDKNQTNAPGPSPATDRVSRLPDEQFDAEVKAAGERYLAAHPEAQQPPTSAELQAKLDQAKQRRDKIKQSYDQEKTSLEKQQRRLVDLKELKLAKGEPVAPEEASTPESVQGGQANLGAGTATLNQSGKRPGMLSRIFSSLRRLVGRGPSGHSALQAGNVANQDSPTLRQDANSEKEATLPGRQKGSDEAASTAKDSQSNADLQQQLQEIMTEIQAIEARLTQMASEIAALDREIAQLEQQVREAKAREGKSASAPAPTMSIAEAIGHSAIAAAGQGDLSVRSSLAKHGTVSLVWFDKNGGPADGFRTKHDPAVNDPGRAYRIETEAGEHFLVPSAFTNTVVRPREMVGTLCDTEESYLSTDRLKQFIPATLRREPGDRWVVGKLGQARCGLSPLLDPRYAESHVPAGEALTACPQEEIADGSVVVSDTIGAVETATVNRYLTMLAKRLRDGEKLVLGYDDARLPSICPEECRVTECGSVVFQNEVTAGYRLDAVRDPGTGEWVTSVEHPLEEAKMALEAQAPEVTTGTTEEASTSLRRSGRR